VNANIKFYLFSPKNFPKMTPIKDPRKTKGIEIETIS
jgi:hypothetical protein